MAIVVGVFPMKSEKSTLLLLCTWICHCLPMHKDSSKQDVGFGLAQKLVSQQCSVYGERQNWIVQGDLTSEANRSLMACHRDSDGCIALWMSCSLI